MNPLKVLIQILLVSLLLYLHGLAIRNHIEKRKKKKQNLENIIQSLASPIKQRVKQNLVDSVLSDVIVNFNIKSVHETTVVANLIEYLKDLIKTRENPVIHETTNKTFEDEMTEPRFLSWLGSKLNI